MSEFNLLEDVTIKSIGKRTDKLGFVAIKTNYGEIRGKLTYIERYELKAGWEGRLVTFTSNAGNLCLAYDQTLAEENMKDNYDDPWIFECHALVKPISVNKAWYMNKKKSKDYVNFQEDMIPYLQGNTCPERVRDNKVKLKADMEFGFSSVRSDVDNCIKTTLDTMQSWFGFDDKIIFELTACKTHVKRGEDYFKIKLTEIKENAGDSTNDT